ncbi:MAG: hypothetical protein K2H64_07760 [Desulfovibrio sp.]|nr:hypothetical protein [Desulfovibrio sp.]
MSKKKIQKITGADGKQYEFVMDIAGSGAMKDVYFAPDKSYVAAFFRKSADFNARDRLENITGVYKDKIFNNEYGEYWKKLFCWPETMIEMDGKLGVISPAYEKNFYFADGPFKGKEKEGKWFSSAKLRNRFLPADQKGDWLKYLQLCLNIARAVRRMHAAGLAHSDLSYKNVLVDPLTGRACIIDIDGLVVPGKFPPDVVGTPDFIAPEVMKTRNLAPGDPARKLPSILTDRHALATLIYMYLLYRHPLRGARVRDADPAKDEELCMGSDALFIEHPADKSNRPNPAQLDPSELPQGDVAKLPYKICGPYLKDLFDRAFIDGLRNPQARPTAADWESALFKTLDLLQPCQNKACEARWYVFDNTKKPRCPFCGTEYVGQLPVLNLYYSPKDGTYKPENYRVMVYDKQSLYPWHANRFIVPNEKMSQAEKKPVGDFHFHKGKWILINRNLPDMTDITENKPVPPGKSVELTEGRKILLSRGNGGRLIVVQLANI